MYLYNLIIYSGTEVLSLHARSSTGVFYGETVFRIRTVQFPACHVYVKEVANMLTHIPPNNTGKVKRTQASRIQFVIVVGILVSLMLLNIGVVAAAESIPASPVPVPTVNPVLQQAVIDNKVMLMRNITNADRMAAAERAAAERAAMSGYRITLVPGPGATPDYFGPYSNYALSQLPIDDGLGNVTQGTGIRKFVDTLPLAPGLGLPTPNNLGQYIPIAVADTTSYPLNGMTPAADYYEIAAVVWTEKMHSDIPPTTIRGYVQLETPVMNIANGSKHIPLNYPGGANITNKQTGLPVYAYDAPHFLGPLIIAQKDKPVRIKFQNYLPVGGNLSIPVDKELMGAGLGPLGVAGGFYSEQRTTIHLHGGNTPYISDGTQHQWTVPAGESTSYPTGVSVKYVPDMDNGIEPVGTLTFYYTNQQSARLMFYHEHAMGITRLGVIAGLAAGYIVQDPAEAAMVASGAIPTVQVPLVIQDRTFIPSAAQMASQDPTWNSGGNTTSAWPHTGDFYFPHVYMPAQNPWDLTGAAPMGRWDYGPWTWPGYMTALNGPVANPYVVNGPGEPPQIPGVPAISQVPETFLDTPIVNGVAYPKLTLGPHAYRFRILNAANERFFNLQLYYAGSNAPMWAGQSLLDGNAGEVNMTPALPGQLGQPADWPVDGRAGGVPWANRSGPSWIQIGSEGGFLPAPVVIPPRPIDWDFHRRSVALLNVLNHSLLIGPAERADVIVDFTGIPSGTKFILYNDAPAPLPGGDSRYDYYTGDANQTLIGGAPTTNPGYGPNTRTIMQIEINSSVAQSGPVWTGLGAVNTQLPAAYALVQDKPLMPESAYNTAFGAAYPDQYIGLLNRTMTFLPAGSTAPVTMNLMPKSIMEGFDPDFGRITAQFGVEVPAVPGQSNAQGIGYFNDDPVTELFNNSVPGTLIGTQADGTQIWKITHNGVDTHIVHVHMFNLQVINRVWWDGTIVPPETNELGWKESVEIHPLQDLVVAMRPIAPNIPWELPNSIHSLNAITAVGSAAPMEFTGLAPDGSQAIVVNHVVNFGYEYLWHCHLLGHEENDMMRTYSVALAPAVPPSNLTAGWIGPNTSPHVRLSWKDNSVAETDWSIQRAAAPTGPWTDIKRSPSTTGPQKGGFATYNDATVAPNTSYFYRVLATNWVGDTTVYPNSIGYPNIAVNSSASNVVSPVLSAPAPFGVGVFRPSNHMFYLKNGTKTTSINWGLSTDTPVTGDWNGDGRTEVGVFRNSTHNFLLKNGTTTTSINWGLSTDTPVTGDWNGDRRTDVGVFRKSTHQFLLKNGTKTTSVYWGLSTDTPVTGDWNGDGRTDVGVFRKSNQTFYLKNGTTTTSVILGLSTDTPVTGDWNGDSLFDVGVFRNSTHTFILKNGTATTSVNWGLSTDLPVTGKW